MSMNLQKYSSEYQINCKFPSFSSSINAYLKSKITKKSILIHQLIESMNSINLSIQSFELPAIKKIITEHSQLVHVLQFRPKNFHKEFYLLMFNNDVQSLEHRVCSVKRILKLYESKDEPSANRVNFSRSDSVSESRPFKNQSQTNDYNLPVSAQNNMLNPVFQPENGASNFLKLAAMESQDYSLHLGKKTLPTNVRSKPLIPSCIARPLRAIKGSGPSNYRNPTFKITQNFKKTTKLQGIMPLCKFGPSLKPSLRVNNFPVASIPQFKSERLITTQSNVINPLMCEYKMPKFGSNRDLLNKPPKNTILSIDKQVRSSYEINNKFPTPYTQQSNPTVSKLKYKTLDIIEYNPSHQWKLKNDQIISNTSFDQKWKSQISTPSSRLNFKKAIN